MANFREEQYPFWEFDVFPRVFVAGKTSMLQIRPQGARRMFASGQTYRLTVYAMNEGRYRDFPQSAYNPVRNVSATEEGGFAFEITFPREQEYSLTFSDDRGEMICRFSVYCVGTDLAGRYPFRGDTHLHTTFSDGKQTPEVVCSNYRAHGLDFLAITDHRCYYPSLKALEFVKSIPTELVVCPGEEVHLPNANGLHNDVHIINFGGEYSINAMMESEATERFGTEPAVRSLYGECPEVMTQAEYDALMQKLTDEMELPKDIDRFPAASCKWIFDQIRKAGGLGIFAHPNWVVDTFHVPERFTDYMVEQGWFDAFEVLGGERYFEQNGFQTLRYYDDRARGYRYPIVGATDSHSSYSSNPGAFICSTIVFSEENERTVLIRSIKDFYSVAVDTISAEYRIVGEPRLARYACFLLKNYFPLHDEFCFEEGRLMRQAAVGTADEREEAIAMLKMLCGRVERQRKKYFAF